MCHFIAAVLFHLSLSLCAATLKKDYHLSRLQHCCRERFLVMGRGVWDHKSRSYLSTPCLDPRGAPFLLSNNFYNPICGQVCPGRGTMQRCQPNNQPNNGTDAAAPRRLPPSVRVRACMCVSKSFRAVSDKLLNLWEAPNAWAARHFLCGDEKSWP